MSPTTPKLADPGALIRAGKILREAEFPVCTDQDLLTEYEELTARLDAAKDAPRDSLASGGDVAGLTEQRDAVEERIAAKTVVLRLRALGRLRWKALKDEHAARKDGEGNMVPADMFLRVNTDTFFEVAVRESLIAPVLDDETRDLLLDEQINDAQWNDLGTLVWNLNEARVSVPFSSAASPSRKTSARK
ncbi:MAG TPA: hypothetical protein VFG87_28780 [Amycolatopsis sp.]|jgi:hypothetical protein|nr:hypothetical protein [Amycolatopsis sp.]